MPRTSCTRDMINVELARLNAASERTDLTPSQMGEVVGAEQALAWVLNHKRWMAPYKSALKTVKPSEPAPTAAPAPSP
jgi:hypothetical protein